MNSTASTPATVSLPDPASALEVTAAQAAALLTGPAAPVLIDCREEDEFAICKIAGATLVPLAAIPTRIPSLLGTTDTPAIIYCHHGMRSMRAVTYLRGHGYTHVFSLRGGINAWSEDIDPAVPVY